MTPLEPSTSIFNVANHLTWQAQGEPDRIALRIPAKSVKAVGETPHIAVTLADFNRQVDATAWALQSVGIVAGMRAILMVPPSLPFFTLTFALLKAGIIPVLIDPGMGIKNLGVCLNDAEPQAFIGSSKAHLARRIFGWAKSSLKITINIGRSRFFCNHALAPIAAAARTRGEFRAVAPQSTDVAAILFTSGSTGIAKGVNYTHAMFIAQIEMLKSTYGIEPGEVDLCTFPLFALFGPALGMTCVIPDMDASRPGKLDPRKAIAQMRQFHVTNLFGSPAVIRRLGEHGASLPDLKRAISAGAPASMPVVERFQRLLPPGVQLFTPYGATESLPITNIGSAVLLQETRQRTEQGHGICVGQPVTGMQVEVIAIQDEPIPEWKPELLLPLGEVGEFVVRGPVVSKSYFQRPEANLLAKIHDPGSGDTWHRLGDVGYRDELGRLWFCGRKSHRVAMNGKILFTDMVEPIFNTIPGVFRSALVGVRRGSDTHPVLCVECDRGANWQMILPQLQVKARQFLHTRAICTFLQHPSFPVDVRHNSKIFREKLAPWADRQLGPRWSGSHT